MSDISAQVHLPATPLVKFDPFNAPAGRELDAFIHHQVLCRPLSANYPEYSTEPAVAHGLRNDLQRLYGYPIIAGQTNGLRRWFARCAISSGDPTEVIADTYALAVCRLALLRLPACEGESPA
jgi:hypothetical protein